MIVRDKAKAKAKEEELVNAAVAVAIDQKPLFALPCCYERVCVCGKGLVQVQNRKKETMTT